MAAELVRFDEGDADNTPVSVAGDPRFTGARAVAHQRVQRLFAFERIDEQRDFRRQPQQQLDESRRHRRAAPGDSRCRSRSTPALSCQGLAGPAEARGIVAALSTHRAVFTRTRSTSATLQACATQPRGVNGGSASKISLIVPIAASPRCASNPDRKPRAACLLVGIGPEPGVDERADQPGPHRPLVIGRVARPQIAEIARFVVRLAGRQRAQPDRGQEPLAHRVDHRAPALLVEHRMVERDREDLVRAE